MCIVNIYFSIYDLFNEQKLRELENISINEKLLKQKEFDEKLERCYPYRDRGNYTTVDQNCRSRVLSELNAFHDEYVKSCFTSISTNSLVQNMPARIKVSNPKTKLLSESSLGASVAAPGAGVAPAAGTVLM